MHHNILIFDRSYDIKEPYQAIAEDGQSDQTSLFGLFGRGNMIRNCGHESHRDDDRSLAFTGRIS